MSKIKSLFLGPNAENLDLFEKIINDIIKDTAFLRRNYQPDDKALITEHDKIESNYVDSVAELHQNLQSVLSALKQSVPTYHPRHIGHMNADVFMSGIAGFFGAMLYNPNNIINVASPTTTDMEIEYINALCSMVGYNAITTKNIETESSQDTVGSWGHLCSGGTAANIEALWVLRNLKYFPITLKIVSSNVDIIGNIVVDKRTNKTIREYDYKDLFNLSIFDIYRLISEVSQVIKNHETNTNDTEDDIRKKIKKFYEDKILKYTVQYLGVAGIHQKTGDEKLDLPKVCIAYTHHYSWEKAMDIVGLGRENLKKIHTNNNFQLDISSLQEELSDKKPVLAVINIMGTTEEGAFDPLDEIIELRKLYNNSFFIHIDGAYGGYFSTFPTDTSVREYIQEVLNEEEIELSDIDNILSKYFNFDDNWAKKIAAVKQADSITIDPHKLGYIPYPAGAILFRDYRSRQNISFDAPYVSNSDSQKNSEIYLGQWTLEGSRPGASAVACCLAGRLLPLNKDGHGKVLVCTVISAIRLLMSINKFNEDKHKYNNFEIVPLFNTDSNLICYIVANKNLITTPNLLNRFTKAVVDELTINPKAKIIPDYEFIISSSTWDYGKYKEPIKHILSEKAHIDTSKLSEMEGKELLYIRSVMMNPVAAFVSDTYYDKYFELIGKIANKALSSVISTLIKEKNEDERINILWVENNDKVKELKNNIETDMNFGHCLNIDFESYNSDTINKIKNNERKYFAAIVDLNLDDEQHIDYSKLKVQTSFNLIREMKKKHNIENVLVYSEYLSDDNSNKAIVISDLMDADQNLELSESYLIGKNKGDNSKDDIEKNKLSIIHAIFNLLQTKEKNNNK